MKKVKKKPNVLYRKSLTEKLSYLAAYKLRNYTTNKMYFILTVPRAFREQSPKNVDNYHSPSICGFFSPCRLS